jgi:hypothetical protein
VMLRLTSTLLILLGLIGWLPSPVTAQGGGNRAALIVRDGAGKVATKCVTFAEESISGEELLNRSGFSVTTKDWGVGKTVCSLNGYGCLPPEDCWCKCQGTSCEYWAYYHWIGDVWRFSNVGVSSSQVKAGALVGFAWGAGTYGSSGAIPPTTSFDAICLPPTATPTSAPTRAPSPTPTLTLTPSSTPTATQAAGGSTPGNLPSSSLPEVLFEATASSVMPNACTVLRWVTWDAQQISLDGVAVAGQDRREVCPQATQRYVLTASSPAGQVYKELTISVIGAAAQPAQAAPPAAPPAASVGSDSQASPLPTPIATQPAESAARPVPTPLPQPPAPREAALGAVAYAQPAPAEMPVRPSSATSAIAAVPTFDLSFLPTPSATRPVVRRQIAEGQATPTPILMARVAAVENLARPGPNTAATSALPPSSSERGFRMSLLPGYGAFVLMAAMLVGAGAVVVRRKRDA